jgi:hypothetical protein
MHHTSARTAISHILAQKGFGERGLALAMAAQCGDADSAALALRHKAMAAAALIPVASVKNYSGELLFAPIPSNEQELCQQLAAATMDLSSDIGLQVANLAGLVALWPHVSSSERALMRQRYLDGLVSDESPKDMHLSRQQLIAWQRELPTAFNEPHASIASLKGLLHETSPQNAYRVMADHLGLNAQLATLSWVLGSLAVQVRLRLHDVHQHISHVILGTSAIKNLLPYMPPEHVATLITQLGHQLWWCRHQANLPPIRTCIDHDIHSLTAAVGAGNITAAQRSARALGQNPELFWQTAWQLVDERITANDPRWYVALQLVLVTAWRTNTESVSPDDAAAIGTVLTDMCHRAKPTPELAAQ